MHALVWAIAVAAIAGIVLRPFRIAEPWWALAGALALVLTGAIPPRAAGEAVGRGIDVYLFLTGMMALGAFAGVTGIFAWVAAHAVRIAGRSRLRLFALVYAVGIVTTALFSNDATIVVLTPAVIVALRRYDASPLPYVVACALIANAASFVLPISNPSNLLVFADRMPSLGAWLAAFALPALGAIAVTFAGLWLTFRRELAGTADHGDVETPPAPPTWAVALLGVSAAAIVLTSVVSGPLGAATFTCAGAAWIAVAIGDRPAARTIVRDISWGIVVLTAALFVILAAVDGAGGFDAGRRVLAWCAHAAAPWSTLATGFIVGAVSNVVNNLPVALNIGLTLPAMHASARTAEAALIGVNLGPNASVSGSLATVMWLSIVRRSAIAVSPLAFARIGVIVTVPALAAALLLLR